MALLNGIYFHAYTVKTGVVSIMR